MGSTHLNYYMHDSRVEILGIIDSDRTRGRKLAYEGNCKSFSNIDEAYAFSNADFADICLPSFLHREAVTKCIWKGSNVIVEKPFALYEADAMDMIECARTNKKRLMVAQVCRFMPQYSQTKKLLDSGTMGKPISFFGFRESPPPEWSNWFRNPSLSGGTLMDLSIHDIDIANWFLGKPETCRAVISSDAKNKGLSYISTSIIYKNGSQATIIANHLLPAKYKFINGFRLLLENGCIEWNTGVFPDGMLGITEGTKTRFVDISKEYEKEFNDPYATELESFISCLISGKSFPIEPEEAMLAVKTVQDLYRSSVSTSPVGKTS
ncbi:MAG: Gfo/Idh/MocA family oxidoreductase [Spirochaetales bacterium]|nr:Gfo/Idh/MocA family oxidoreductase [Spirochaetales bacterium]